MTIDIRPTGPDEYRQAADVVSVALMVAPPSDEAWERSLPSWHEMPSLSAWDGARCVGHAGQFLVETSVPGGARLATGAVSRVGVLSSHRRRGVATALIEGLVHDAAERALPLMSLRASEATIYGRYGFGVAGESCEVDLASARARPVGGAATGGSVRLLEPDEIIATVEPVYERAAHRRAGAITRPPSFWQRYFRSAIDRSNASFVVVHSDADGVDDGYVHYDVRWDEETTDEPAGRGEVHDLWAATDGAELALWAYVLDVDLVGRWKLGGRPVDDLVRRALADSRAYRQVGRHDEQWLRLVDVDAALAARSYRAALGSVTIGVCDRILPANSGTWTVSAEGAARTDAEPELVVDVATLSAAYLGGPSWSQLAGAGTVGVRRPDAIEIADTLFATARAPFCGSFF